MPEHATDGGRVVDDRAGEETRFTRRPFLKLAGGTAAGTALAGCAGSGEGGGGTPAGQETVAVGGNEATTAGSGTASRPFGNVGWKLTDTQSLHSPRAKRTFRKLVGKFDSATGASTNLSIGPGPGDQKHKVLFGNDKYPVAWIPNIKSIGSVMTISVENDIMYTFSEMQGMIDDEVLSGLGYLFEDDDSMMRVQHSGWIERGDLDIGWGAPCGHQLWSAYWLANKNHYEEAGLALEEDFPPRDYEHMLEVGRTLTDDGPGRFGLQLVGSSDAGDCGLPPWAINLAASQDGAFFTKDWTRTNFANDVWKEAARLYVETFTKHGLGSPETPTISDENATVLVAKGDVSLASVEPLTIPLIRDQNPAMMEDLVAVWGPNYLPYGEGDEWEPARPGPFNYIPNHAPPQADAAKWEKKVEVAMAFFNGYLMDENFQEFNYPNDLGITQTRADTWDRTVERMEEKYPRHLVISTIEQLRESRFPYAAHPAGLPVGTLAAELSLAFKEEQTPEEAMDATAEKFQKVLDDSIFGA